MSEVLNIKPKIRRRFLGKIDGFKNKQERDFEKKHLRAYLKGWDRFVIGYTYDKMGIRYPAYEKVKQELYEDNKNDE